MSTFEQILDQVSALPVEQQERLVEAIQQGIRSARRKELAVGNLKPLNTDEAGTTLRIAIEEPDETELIERIRLAPPFDGERLAVLQAKRDAGTLPEAELLEWQQLKIAADRWESKQEFAVVKLASLRQVAVPEIQAEFGLEVSNSLPLAQQLLEFERICREENYTLIVPERINRPTPFD